MDVDLLEFAAAVDGPVEARVLDEDGVLVRGMGIDVGVVPVALPELPVPVDPFPGRACVVGPVDAALGIVGVHQRPNPIRIRGRHGEPDLSGQAFR